MSIARIDANRVEDGPDEGKIASQDPGSDGAVSIDNNVSEREMKRVVLGRVRTNRSASTINAK